MKRFHHLVGQMKIVVILLMNSIIGFDLQPVFDVYFGDGHSV